MSEGETATGLLPPLPPQPLEASSSPSAAAGEDYSLQRRDNSPPPPPYGATAEASPAASPPSASPPTAASPRETESSLLSLRWREYPSSVVRALRALKEEGEFVDVTLACGRTRQFNAHKVVLSACSPYFRRLLKVSGITREFANEIPGN